MNRLVLIRHGRTDGSDRRLYYGATDLPVNEAGLRELEARAGEYPSCEGFRVLTTGYLRTEQTLRAICGEVPHEAAPELGEIRFGIFEMKSYDELKNRADYQAWLAGDWMANVPPGGESFNMAQSRVRRALEGLLRGPEDVLRRRARRDGHHDHAAAFPGDRPEQLRMAPAARLRLRDRP
jgi:alpha-ribazole phosphatase